VSTNNKENRILDLVYPIYGLAIVAILALGLAMYFILEAYFPEFSDNKMVLLGGFSFALILLIVAVIIPTTRQLKNVVQTATKSEGHSKELADQISELNKELQDINGAIERSTILVKTDAKGRIVDPNIGFCKICKYEAEEIIGKPLFLNREGPRESIIYDHIRGTQKGQVWYGEVIDHAKDGTLYYLDVSLIPIKSVNNEVYQYLAICVDATAKRLEEESRKTASDLLLRDQKILTRATISGQELERKRMAQELHDGIGQMLTGLSFGLESINLNDEQQADRFQKIKAQLKDVIRELRRISSDLRPVVLTDFGVISAIKDLVKTLQSTSDISIELEDETSHDIRFHKAIEVGLYRVAQEAINNALKHAGAEMLTVFMENDEHFLIVQIRDNGKGFNVQEKIDDKSYSISGNGIGSMYQRAELMQSELKIESKIGMGTTVQIKVPIEKVSEFYEQN
jgi:PAS domain S-box-containing protein